jgi:hypothetical protein
MAIDPKELAIHDEVGVETEIDGVFVGLQAFVANVLDEELWLATRRRDPRLLSLTAGQPMHLSFDRDGALVVESVFMRRLGNARLGTEKTNVFSVRRPVGVETVQRRAHVRVNLERTVRIRALGSLETEGIGSGRTINIGAGGVQLTTDMPLIFGEQLRLALVLTPATSWSPAASPSESTTAMGPSRAPRRRTGRARLCIQRWRFASTR